MKKLFYSGLVFIGIIGFFLVKIYTFNHQQFVSEYLSKLSGSRFLITTDYISSIKISASPYIKIKNINVIDKEIVGKDNNIFTASDAQIRFSFFDIILGKKNTVHLKLDAPTLNILSSETIQSYIDYFKKATIINSISVANGKICDLVSKDCNKYISQFDLEFGYNKSASTLSVNWGVLPENKFSLIANFKNTSQVSASINGESAKFTLTGNTKNNSIYGDVEGEIFNHKFLFQNIFKSFSLLDNLNITGSKESIKITTKMSLGLDKLELSDIKINSSNISGTGNIYCHDKEDSKIEMNLNKIVLTESLDQVSNQDLQDVAKNVTKNFIAEENFFSLSKLKNLESIITFNELIIEDKKFNDFIINYKTKDNAVYSASASGLYNNIKFALNNSNFDQNENTLISDLTLEGNNINSIIKLFLDKKTLGYDNEEQSFNLSSKLKISPAGLNFNDIILNINNSLVTGNINKVFGKFSEYTGEINFSNFDFNKISSNHFKETVRYFILNSSENSYLAKFKILRELNDKIDLEIKVKDSLIDNLSISELTSKILLEKGQLNVDKFVINSDFAKIDKLKFSLDSRVINPNINLEVKGNKLNLDYILNKFSLLEDESINVGLENKDINNVNALDQSKSILPNEKINFFHFSKFTGSINLDISDINIRNHGIANIALSSTINDEALLLNPLALKWKNGDLNIKGAITQDYDQAIISINFIANNMDLSSISELIELKKVRGGKVNFTGNLYTAGDNRASLINNLQLTIPFSARDLAIEGFDLKNLILQSTDKKFNSEQEIKDFLGKMLEPSILVLPKVQGYLKVKKGLAETENINFEAPYSLGVFGGVVDLNKLTFKGQSNITFVLEHKTPIVIAISNYGNLNNFDSVINTNLLEDHLKGKIVNKPDNGNDDLKNN